MAIEKTVTDDATLGIKKASVKLTLPVVELDCYTATADTLNIEIKERLVGVIKQYIDKHLT